MIGTHLKLDSPMGKTEMGWSLFILAFGWEAKLGAHLDNFLPDHSICVRKANYTSLSNTSTTLAPS